MVKRKEIVLGPKSLSVPLKVSYCWQRARKLPYIKLAKGTRQNLAATVGRDRITEKAPPQDPVCGIWLGLRLDQDNRELSLLYLSPCEQQVGVTSSSSVL